MAILGGLRIHSTAARNSNRANSAPRINIRRNQVETARLKQRPKLFSIEACSSLKDSNVLFAIMAGFSAVVLSLPILLILASHNIYLGVVGVALSAFNLGGGTAHWFLNQSSHEATKNKVQINV
jgi:hypothetical protein